MLLFVALWFELIIIKDEEIVIKNIKTIIKMMNLSQIYSFFRLFFIAFTTKLRVNITIIEINMLGFFIPLRGLVF